MERVNIRTAMKSSSSTDGQKNKNAPRYNRFFIKQFIPVIGLVYFLNLNYTIHITVEQRDKRQEQLELFGNVWEIKDKGSVRLIAETQEQEKISNEQKKSGFIENKNTNWGNVQYKSGYFNKADQLDVWQKDISSSCVRLLGFMHNEIFDSGCSGPITTPHACCYCYQGEYPQFLLLDDAWKRSSHATELEQYKESTNATSVFWFCAEERNNTLSSDWTHIDSASDTNEASVKGGNVVVVSGKFGYNNPFKNVIDTFCQQALKGGILKERGKDLFCYSEFPDFILQNDRFSRHMRFLTDPNDESKRGGGYWFFKAALMQHHAHNSKDGVVLVWADADRIDLLRQGTFNTIINTLSGRGGDFLIEYMAPHYEYQWTKGDMLEAFNASESIRQSAQVTASSFVIRNSPRMRQFIDAFVDCMFDWHMVSDEPSILPNSPGFFENRHDQSVINMLVKTFMTRQGMVGPPARTYYNEADHYDTYKLLDNINPFCPFASFYSAMLANNKSTKHETRTQSNIALKEKTSVDGFIRGTRGQEESRIANMNNTNWGNVQYRSGYFNRAGKLEEWEQLIHRTCNSQSGIRRVEIFDSFCSVPVATPFSCCYCYEGEYPEFLLLDDAWKQSSHATELEQYKESTNATSVFWFCSEPRENSLSSDWTHIELASAVNDTSVNGSKIVVLSGKFGFNNMFQDDMDAFCERALSGGILKERGKDVFCYSELPDSILQNDKFSRHMRFLTDPDDESRRGGGYWFFKSALLQLHANNLKDGDILVWVDEDRIDLLRQGSFNTIIETLSKRGDDLLIETMDRSTEHMWTKEDMLEAFNASESLRQSRQINGNAVVIRNSPHMRKFIDAFLDCASDWHMISDDPSVLPNAPGFYESRHDQSILSLLVKTFMTRQGMVGPPARTYHDGAQMDTYRLTENDVDPICPFSSFYKQARLEIKTT